jgi:uncharacterized phage protein gp47/JayE
MPITYPASRKEVIDRIKTDLQNALPETDPFLRNSYIGAIATALGGAVYDTYMVEKILQRDLFYDTATGSYADRWGALVKVMRNPASQSIGNIVVTGLIGSIVPPATELKSANGISYVTTNTSNLIVASNTMYVTSMVRDGTTVTVTTASEHGFATNNLVSIQGSSYGDYNGTFKISVFALNKFTYNIVGMPPSPAIGIITATLFYISCPIKSVELGAQTVLESGSELIFNTLLAGIDSNAYVNYYGITGGVNVESDEDYRNRYIYAYQHPVSFFSAAELIILAKTVPGVTRVFVQETTPDTGQVTVYFTRDNDSNPIPSPSQVQDVKDVLDTIRPAHVDPRDLIVLAPTAFPVNFVFATLEPNTTTMQMAITNSLQALFDETPIVGQALSRYSYQAAIYQTIDPSTGQFVTSFLLGTPTGDITVGSGKIAILGSITYPS